MIILKTILQEKRLYGLTIKEVLDKFLTFEGKTLIFFDTETTSLWPRRTSHQILEIAAIVIDGSTMKELGRFHKKIKLNNATRLVADKQDSDIEAPDEKHPGKKKHLKYRDILRMTAYGEKHAEYFEEKQVLQEFSDFLNQYTNVTLVAHNAAFDMKFIMVRGRRHGVKFPSTQILDTVKIVKLFFWVAILVVNGYPFVNEYLLL